MFTPSPATPRISAPIATVDLAKRLTECREIEREGGSAEATRRELIHGFELNRKARS